MIKCLNEKWPFIAAIVTAVIFGFSFLFTKSALDSLSIFQLLGFRFAAAAIFLTALWLIGLIKLRIRWMDIKDLLIIAFLQPVLYFILETIGVGFTSASESGIIIALVPISVTLFAVFLLKEQITLFKWVSIGISVAGVILIAQSGENSGAKGHLSGVIALVGAVVAAGLYNVLSKKVSAKYAPIETTFIMMWVGAVVFNFAGILSYSGNLTDYFSGIANTAVIVDILYLGILSSVGAFFLLNYVLSKMDASRSAVFMNLTPVVSVLAGIFFRDEKFYLLQCIGAILILAGIWGANYRGSKKLITCKGV